MNVINFIQSFIARKGLNVLFSVVLAKLINFIVAIVIIRLLSQEDYGLVAYGLTIISFVAPFVGAGLHQGFLRYGALSKGQYSKKVLFQITFWKGLKYTVLIAVAVMLLSPILSFKLSGSGGYLILMSLQLISLFVFQMIQVYCRLIHRNKLFASIDIQNNLLLLIFNISLCYFFGALGYIIGLILVPLVVGIYYLKKLNLLSFQFSKKYLDGLKNTFDFDFKEFFYYGLFTSTGGVLSQLLYAIDILLIGNMLSNPELVAQYKASSLIPFSLIMLPIAVMTTDFVKLAGNSNKNKKALQQYYLNYLKIFSLISLGIIVFFYFFSEHLLGLFGADYQGHARLMFIFAIGVVGGLLFRVPLGNLLSAIGWPRINALFSVIVLITNLIANYFMITWYGIEGAAITTSFLMWFSGLLSLGAFVYFLRT